MLDRTGGECKWVTIRLPLAEAHPVTPSVAPSEAPAAARGLRRLAAALHHRDFRVLWFGACFSSIGTWMQSLAENWLVLSLTASAFYLGLDAFLQQVPIMLFTLIGGVVADRYDRRITLMASQWVQLSTAAALAICFGLNALSFLAVILSLMSLHIKHMAAARAHNMFAELKQGLAYVREERSIRALMVLGAATAFFGIPMLTLLPVFARDVFGSGVEGYSMLLSFSGAGAVAGAMVVAWLGRFARMGFTTLLVQACFGVIIALIALAPSLSLTYVLLFASGVTLMIVVSCLMSLVQLIAPNEMRGRVMSIYLVAFRGGMPLGSLASGSLASITSAPNVLAFNGVALIAVSVYFLMKTKEIRAL